jgi:two-component system, response regulator
MKSSLRTILLVEDSLPDAKLVMLALKKSNISNPVIHLRDGTAAIEFLYGAEKMPGLPPDEFPGLILLDLKMPRMNGKEVLQKLKTHNNTSKIPVVVFTSSQEDPDIKECYRLGVNSYIVKPLSFEKFSETIREIGLYWLIVNRVPA